MSQPVPISELADRIGAHPSTVQGWLRRGLLTHAPRPHSRAEAHVEDDERVAVAARLLARDGMVREGEFHRALQRHLQHRERDRYVALADAALSLALHARLMVQRFVEAGSTDADEALVESARLQDALLNAMPASARSRYR